MCGTSKVGWFDLASLLRLLPGDLVIHVGRYEGNGLSGLARCDHFISGDVASANRNK
jgi:hypothetical protein